MPPTAQASPFWVAWYETDFELEKRIFISAAVHILASLLVIRLSKDSWMTAKLRQKETPAMASCLFAAYVVGFVHAIIVSVSAVLVVVYGRYEVWPPTIALSIGYFISDFIFFALPTKQPVMVIHHLVMIVGHYPTMELPAATLYGAGDAHLIMWLSAVGYLTEISNIFLDVRWFQLKVFEGPPADWSYALNSLFLLVSYILTRVLIMPVAAYQYLLPRYGAYAATGQLPAFYIIAGGTGFISLMSVVYTYILLKGGLKAFFFYSPPKKKAA